MILVLKLPDRSSARPTAHYRITSVPIVVLVLDSFGFHHTNKNQQVSEVGSYTLSIELALHQESRLYHCHIRIVFGNDVIYGPCHGRDSFRCFPDSSSGKRTRTQSPSLKGTGREFLSYWRLYFCWAVRMLLATNSLADDNDIINWAVPFIECTPLTEE